MRFVSFLALALLPPVCAAGGSVRFGRIDHLLQQKPEIRAVLRQSLEMPTEAFAQVRLGPHFKHLSGDRIGPYTFEASPKTKGLPVLVTLCTSALFLDSAGRVLPTGSDQEFGATHIRELLNAVVLRDVGVSSAAACP